MAHTAHTHGHGHGSAAVAAPGEVRPFTSSPPFFGSLLHLPRCHSFLFPTRAVRLLQPIEFLSDPSRSSTTRCKRRWNDLVMLRLDALAPKTTTGTLSLSIQWRRFGVQKACVRVRLEGDFICLLRVIASGS